ncbi:MFS transporter [Bradyrhizobium sp. 33ap4]|uniref:MFS transporter n=1 Tax=Bradyrhizobium sp. 33ap4 TaxID=3061630 RepID=UPI00292CD6E1|nr:MFS transporter [Bradyrhizobium sp. 33ap4]
MAGRSAHNPAPSQIQTLSPWSALKHRRFRWLWFANICSQEGIWLNSLSGAWLMATMSQSPTMVALVQTAIYAPTCFLTVIAGVLADRWDRKLCLLGAQYLMIFASIGMAVLAFGQAFSPWLLLGAIFAFNCGWALSIPAWQALSADLVEPEEIIAISSLGTISFNVARVIGSPIIGVGLGFGVLFTVSAACLVPMAGALILTHTSRARHCVMRDEAGFWRELLSVSRVSGFGRFLMLIAIVSVGSSALWALVPFVTAAHNLGASTMGLAMASLGAGAIIGAQLLPLLGRGLNADGLICVGGCAMAAAVGAIAVADSRVALALVVLVAGAGYSIMSSLLCGAAQALFDAAARGRGAAIYTTVSYAAFAVGGALWGAIASLGGVVLSLLCAAATLLVAGALARKCEG